MLDEKNDNVIIGVDNVSKYLEISRTTIYRMIKKKKFPLPERSLDGYKIVRIWKKEDLDRFKEEHLKRVVQVNQENSELKSRLDALEKKVEEMKLIILRMTALFGK